MGSSYKFGGWLSYAVWVNLGDAVADELYVHGREQILLEMTYCALYHFNAP